MIKLVENEGVRLCEFCARDAFGTKLAGLDFTSCNIEGLTVSDTGAELKGAKVDVWQAAMFAKLFGVIVE